MEDQKNSLGAASKLGLAAASEEEGLFRLLGEYVEQHLAQIEEYSAALKRNSRECRKTSFEAYYGSIRAEDDLLERLQHQLLADFLRSKGIHSTEYLSRFVRVDQQKLTKFLAQKTVAVRLSQSFSKEERFTRQELQEYISLKVELTERAKVSPGWQNEQLRPILSRMIEDACFDKFGMEDKAVMDLGHLLKLPGVT